jgi:hypothetical protein
MQNDPVICYDVSIEEAAAAGGWQQANNYNLWVGKQTPSDLPYRLLERRPEGAVHLPFRSRLMHCVPAGMPFRVAHLFGPWRVSDADMIYLRVEEAEGVYHTLVTAMCRDVKQDQLLWACQSCGAEIGRAEFDTGRHGFAGYWSFMLEQVRAFNQSPERRVCPACGERHPVAYGFDAAADTADEAAARRAW